MDHILQILISLAIIFFLFSTLTSVVFEWYSYKTQKRGRFLYQALHRLLHDPLNQSYGASLYAHYSIDRLKKDRHSYPQYISSSMFADALIETIASQSEKTSFELKFKEGSFNLERVALKEDRIADTFQRFAAGVDAMGYSPFKSQLRAFQERSGNYPELKKTISAWYDDYMQRASGWYKTGTRRAIFCISLAVALIFNLDAIHLVKVLNYDEALRKKLVLAAENISDNKTVTNGIVPADSLHSNFPTKAQRDMAAKVLVHDSTDKQYMQRVDSLLTVVEDLSIPVGYHSNFAKEQLRPGFGFYWLAGILCTALALSFGAPFWFDVLIKVTNIRRSGSKPEEQVKQAAS